MEVRRKDGGGSYLRISESKVLLSGFPEHKMVGNFPEIGLQENATLSDLIKKGAIWNLS